MGLQRCSTYKTSDSGQQKIRIFFRVASWKVILVKAAEGQRDARHRYQYIYIRDGLQP